MIIHIHIIQKPLDKTHHQCHVLRGHNSHVSQLILILMLAFLIASRHIDEITLTSNIRLCSSWDFPSKNSLASVNMLT
jgi:hypothetical protein